MKPWTQSAIAAAVAASLYACGGSGGSGGGSSPAQLTLGGTAAVGAPLAQADVSVKCATGSGTATTSTTGTYSVSIEGGILPCIIQVSGDANGVSIVLHSVADTGTASGNVTQAVANVTPVTEMILAALTGALPAELFSDFNAGAVTTSTLQAATTAVVTALKDALNIDLSAIDPFKATLVAATGSTQGNAYDQLLDNLGLTITPQALPALVAQLATQGATDGATEVLTAAAGGAAPSCPTVLSGDFRAIQHFGHTYLLRFDFGTNTMKLGGASGIDFSLAPVDGKPCEFTAAGTNSQNQQLAFRFTFGPSGAGAFRAVNTTATTATIGHVFPAQSHSLSAIADTWTVLQTGWFWDQEGNTSRLENGVARLTLAANGSATACDYDTIENPVCEGDTPLTFATRTDGGFTLFDGGQEGARVYAYKAPNGDMLLYGTTNPAGLPQSADVEATHFVATRQRTLPLPAVNTTSQFWEVAFRAGQSPATSVTDRSFTVTAVNTATSTVNREIAGVGTDTVQFNHPFAGVRYRQAIIPFTEALQLPLINGAVLMINSGENDPFVYSISIAKP